MPGMIDTHRHMWQTVQRGYGADWTLTQYFVYYYLEHGKHFRPEDIHAGNLLAAAEAIDAGVTTCVDWSHNNHTTDHADAAVDALQAIPGRFVFAYGNIQAPPWEWSTTPEFRDFVSRRITGDDMLGFQIAFDIPGDPSFPEQAAFEVARDLGVAGDHARRRLGRHQRRRHPADARARLHDAGVDLRARGDADRGLLPADRGHRRLGLGGDRERAERRAGLPAHLGDPQARHPGLAVDGHQRLVERRPVLRDAVHAGGGPLARAPGGARQRRHGHPQRAPRRAGRRLGHPRRRQGARPRRLAGQRRGRQEGRPGAAQERRLAGLVPDPQPLRPRGVPGPARRRAHRAGRRPGREARRRAGRRRPRRRSAPGGRDHRAPALDDGRRGLAGRA